MTLAADLADHPYLLSILLGVLEGLTEFLPISSTAHLRLVKPWAGVSLEDPYWKMYDVVIQLGAILAVVLYFRGRLVAFLRTFPRGERGDRTILNHPLSLVLLASAVTIVPAYLLSRIISANLESLLVIGLSLLVGGVVMWIVDVMFSRPGFVRTETMEQMSWRQASWIGAVQVLAAVFPGVSRSMATIAAGQSAGLTRSAALEFSFFVSIPVMFAACSYNLFKTLTATPGEPEFLEGGLSGEDWGVLATGFGVAFVVAWGVIAWFMAWVRRHGFVPFAVYRIVIGVLVLGWAFGLLGN